MYLDYNGLKKRIEDFKAKQKNGIYVKLPGYYLFTEVKTLVLLDSFNPLKHSICGSDVPRNIDIEEEKSNADNLNRDMSLYFQENSRDSKEYVTGF